MQQQAAGREGGRAGDVEDKRKAGRAGDVKDKRKSGRAGNLTQSAAARRRHRDGHDDDAFISPTRTSCIPGHASVRDRIDRAKGMSVRQAIQLTIYTARSLKRDETAGYIRGSSRGGPTQVPPRRRQPTVLLF